jgi:hypothetical protein
LLTAALLAAFFIHSTAALLAACGAAFAALLALLALLVGTLLTALLATLLSALLTTLLSRALALAALIVRHDDAFLMCCQPFVWVSLSRRACSYCNLFFPER